MHRHNRKMPFTALLAAVALLALTLLLAPAPVALAQEGVAPNQPDLFFEGEVLARPEGAEGLWTIGRAEVLATPRTHFIPNAAAIQVGDQVHVVAVRERNQLIAKQIIKKVPPPRLIQGEIKAIDAAMGLWTIGQHQVRVNAETKLSGDPPEVGAWAMAWVVRQEEELLARRIYVKGAKPRVEPVTFRGEVMEINESVYLIKVGEEVKTVLTDEDTRIEGDPQVGDMVGVRGHKLEDGSVLAHHIVKLEPRPEPVLFGGFVSELLPTLTVMPPQWAWQVTRPAHPGHEAESWIVIVTSETRINVDPATVEVGAWVKGEGVATEAGSILARVAKVMPPPRVRFIGEVLAAPDPTAADFPAGVWQIGEFTVHVTAETEIQGDAPALGDIAGGSGELQMDGSIQAALLRILRP